MAIEATGGKNAQRATGSHANHRERLRERFLHAAEGVRTDAEALELLLCYAIPQRDVRPLADDLIRRFGTLDGVLAAPLPALEAVPGVKRYVATLLKLGHYLRTRTGEPFAAGEQTQLALFEQPREPGEADTSAAHRESKPRKPPVRKREGPFSKSVFREALDVLPQLPDGLVGLALRQFVQARLHFSAVSTRERYGNYIIRRMLPATSSDDPIVAFARSFAQTQALRDVCFYRFCLAEPLMAEIARDVLVPATGQGKLYRTRLQEYLRGRYPTSGSLEEALKACVDVLLQSGVATGDSKVLTVSYRPVALPSFAFVLHSEFSEPGIYPIAEIENGGAYRTLLWNPDSLLPSLYELRNQGVISKISEIDTYRQFTVSLSLQDLVKQLAAGGGRP